MGLDPYAALGLKPGASAAEVKSAYRNIALRHHPDRSSTAESKRIFTAAKEAYELLSDPNRKRQIDQAREEREQASRIRDIERERAQTQAQVQSNVAEARTARDIAEDVQRLSRMFWQGRHANAERLAEEILARDRRQPIPYAVLGDLARARGDLDLAAQHYAYAAQFAPNNELFQKRYEEILSGHRVVDTKRRQRVEASTATTGGLTGAAIATVVGAILCALPSAWTFGPGFWLGCLISGVGIGAGLAVGNWLDRFSGLSVNALGKPGPAITFGLGGAVCFWLAAIWYAVRGGIGKSYNVTLSRFLGALALAAPVLALGAAIPGGASPLWTLLLGPNVATLAAMLAWASVDAMRKD
ncbi:hypothetical protein EON79_00835 [bacterium]|nr:MAG: hypothetical protein EON79_00835 [bacterium]